MEWKSAYSLGIKEIDDQHRHIVISQKPVQICVRQLAGQIGTTYAAGTNATLF